MPGGACLKPILTGLLIHIDASQEIRGNSPQSIFIDLIGQVTVKVGFIDFRTANPASKESDPSSCFDAGGAVIVKRDRTCPFPNVMLAGFERRLVIRVDQCAVWSIWPLM